MARIGIFFKDSEDATFLLEIDTFVPSSSPEPSLSFMQSEEEVGVFVAAVRNLGMEIEDPPQKE